MVAVQSIRSTETRYRRLSKDYCDKLMCEEKVMTSSKPEKLTGPRNLLDGSWLLLPTFRSPASSAARRVELT
jgi:hypothetical protein